MNKIFKYFADREYRNFINVVYGLFGSRHLSDEEAIKILYKAKFGIDLKLENPQTFNEKLQWLKLYNRNPEFTKMVDKYEAKAYVAKIIGDEYIIPTLGVYNQFEDIDFEKLPNRFVIKCTHDSGGLVICEDKSELNIKAAKKKIKRCLKKDYYSSYREWPYKDVRPRIIVEQYLIDEHMNELRDYKFFCFNGQVKCFKVDFDRFIDHHANYYDENNNLLKFGEIIYPPLYDKEIELPKTIEKMKILAEKLSKGSPFLRIDFYEVDGKIYFGEITFFPASGLGKFDPEEWDLKLGEWLELKQVENLTDK